MSIAKCPECGKVVSLHFPLHDCRKVVRYFVSPAPTLRGWFLMRVVRIDGVEKTDSWKEKFQTKREAHSEKDKRNRKLGRNFESARMPSSGIAGIE